MAVTEEADSMMAAAAMPVQQGQLDFRQIIQKEVAAAFRTTGARPKGPINMDAPKEPRETQATMKLGPIKKRDWIFCQRCGVWGQHIRAECKLSPNEVKRMTKQDPKARPSEQPNDAQYPN